MGQLLLYVAAALVIAAIVFGVTVMLGAGDPGLTPAEPDGKAVPLPSDRPLGEDDLIRTKFDTALRGYRMSQVDQALQRAAYDIGYKGELIGVLEAEVLALREGRSADADMLRRAREAALSPTVMADDVAAITEPPEAEPFTEPATGQNPAAGAVSGQQPAPKSAAGQKPATEPAPGQNPAAQPAPGQNPGGQPAAGQKSAGKPAASQKSAAQPAAGQNPAAQSAAEDDDRDGEAVERR